MVRGRPLPFNRASVPPWAGVEMSLDTARTSACATVLLWSLNCFVEPNMKHFLVVLLGVCLAPLALAKPVLNTIDPVAIVSGNGLHVVVTGPIACTEGER